MFKAKFPCIIVFCTMTLKKYFFLEHIKWLWSRRKKCSKRNKMFAWKISSKKILEKKNLENSRAFYSSRVCWENNLLKIEDIRRICWDITKNMALDYFFCVHTPVLHSSTEHETQYQTQHVIAKLKTAWNSAMQKPREIPFQSRWECEDGKRDLYRFNGSTKEQTQ